MLQRNESKGVVLISQPAHSWVAGQLARQWGDEFFGNFVPADDVYLATALHDIGFVNWEQAPTLNPKTGLPYLFRDLPSKVHYNLWIKSVQKMMNYGRYPALLVSMHFVHLSQKQRQMDSPMEFDLKKRFLNSQEVLQTTLLTSLQNDFYYEPFTAPEVLTRSRKLLSIWDWMSLALCMDFEEAASIEGVPAANGETKLTLTKTDSGRVRVSPWPFKEQQGKKRFQFTCEGRRMLTTFSDEVKMHEALRSAAPVTIALDLVP